MGSSRSKRVPLGACSFTLAFASQHLGDPSAFVSSPHAWLFGFGRDFVAGPGGASGHAAFSEFADGPDTGPAQAMGWGWGWFEGGVGPFASNPALGAQALGLRCAEALLVRTALGGVCRPGKALHVRVSL